jgi:PAS domain-containing protein
MDRPPLFAARRIAGIYTLLGALWIIASDRLLGTMVLDSHTLTLIQTYKGWAFVLASGLLIFLVLSRELRGRLEDEKLLRESEQRYRSLFDNMLDGFAYCKMFFEDGKLTCPRIMYHLLS